MSRLAIITCRNIPEPDPDETLLMRSLSAAGIDATLAAWDDPSFRPGDYSLCVLRSCWNYFEAPDRFVAWIDAAAASTRLANPAGVLRWNHHKAYLNDLADAGVPIVPTAWVARGEGADLAALMGEHNWDKVVVKPAVSASSHRTRAFSRARIGDGQAFLHELQADRDAMVQQFMEEVGRSGELCIMYIDGRYTHTIRKAPRFAGGVEKVASAQAVTPAQRAIADQALSCVKEPLLYARIDLIGDGSGGYLLSELELIEPSLYLKQSPDALAHFVDALGRWQDAS